MTLQQEKFCTIKRENTSSPLQSLVLLNDVQFFEASRVFAERIFSESNGGIKDHITYGFRLATSRFPKENEIELLDESLPKPIAFLQKKSFRSL